jgi:hypothetical protein
MKMNSIFSCSCEEIRPRWFPGGRKQEQETQATAYPPVKTIAAEFNMFTSIDIESRMRKLGILYDYDCWCSFWLSYHFSAGTQCKCPCKAPGDQGLKQEIALVDIVPGSLIKLETRPPFCTVVHFMYKLKSLAPTYTVSDKYEICISA